jgi:hypothetical protein
MELKRYVQYRVELKSPSGGFTPRLSRISLGFNGPPSLALAGHYPFSGNLSTVFTFLVTYADPDGTLPVASSLVLDGTSAQMAPLTGGDPKTNLQYEYSTRLAQGAHRYYFLFNDGFGDLRLPATGDLGGPLVNAEPGLSEGAVDPPEGNTSTVFSFTVRYRDPERAPAVRALLVIDGVQNLTMQALGDGGQSPAVYGRNTTLPAGTHGFSFRFSDGQTEVRLPLDGEFAGPEVLAPPVPPRLLEVFPPEGARDVPVNSTVEATFDHAMDAGSLSAASFILMDARDRPVKGRISLDAGGNKAILRPIANLSWNETYTVRLTTGILDENGSAFQSEHNWSFTTVLPVTRNRPPVVPPRLERTVTEGEELVLDLEAVDPDGDALHYRVLSGPRAVKVNGSGFLKWMTAPGDRGRHSIVVEVSDGNLSALAAINVTVEEAAGGGGTAIGGMGTIFPALVLILVAAVALAAAVLVLRRRKGPAAPGRPETGPTPPAAPPPDAGPPPGQR